MRLQDETYRIYARMEHAMLRYYFKVVEQCKRSWIYLYSTFIHRQKIMQACTCASTETYIARQFIILYIHVKYLILIG